MKSLRNKGLFLLLSAALLLAYVGSAEGQRFRPRVRVYRPGSHNNTRALMNRRAAAKKALRKRQEAKAKRAKASQPKLGQTAKAGR